MNRWLWVTKDPVLGKLAEENELEFTLDESFKREIK